MSALLLEAAHFLNRLISDEENGKVPFFDERAAKDLVLRMFAATGAPCIARSEPGGYAEPKTGRGFPREG